MSQIVCIDKFTPDYKYKLLNELTFFHKQREVKRGRNYGRQKSSVDAYIKDDELGLEILTYMKKASREELIKLEVQIRSEGNSSLLRLPFNKAVEEFGTSNDNREFKVTNVIRNPDFRLSDEQLEIANKIIADLKERRTATLCLSTGGGKTAISCVLSSVIKLLTVVFVQNKVLMGQWKNEAEKFTNSVTHIIDRDSTIPENVDFIVCHIKRYYRIPRKLRDKVGFMIVDESPLLCNKIGVNAMLSLAPKYMLACSATPSRSRDGMYAVMDSFFGEHQVRLKKQKDMIVIKVSTKFEGEKTLGGLNWTTYIQSILYNQERNEKIIEAITRDLVELDCKIMVLTTEKKHVMLLYNMLIEAGVEADWLSGNKKMYRNCDILVGNIQKCGVGFDDANFCQDHDGKRISLAWIVSEIANEELAEQVVGRIRISNPLIKQVVDKDSLSQKHWRLCSRVYKTNGAEIKYDKL